MDGMRSFVLRGKAREKGCEERRENGKYRLRPFCNIIGDESGSRVFDFLQEGSDISSHVDLHPHGFLQCTVPGQIGYLHAFRLTKERICFRKSLRTLASKRQAVNQE